MAPPAVERPQGPLAVARQQDGAAVKTEAKKMKMKVMMKTNRLAEVRGAMHSEHGGKRWFIGATRHGDHHQETNEEHHRTRTHVLGTISEETTRPKKMLQSGSLEPKLLQW